MKASHRKPLIESRLPMSIQTGAEKPRAPVTSPRAPTLSRVLATLEERARNATSITQLAISIVNETYGLYKFRQALVFKSHQKSMRLLAISSLPALTEDSPYLVWLDRALPWLVTQTQNEGGWFTPNPNTMPPAVLEGWQEWWTQGVLVWPIKSQPHKILGWVVFLLEEPPLPWQMQALARLSLSWGHCWEMLIKQQPLANAWRRWRALGKWRFVVIMAAMLAMAFIPIHETVMVPSEIISSNAKAVTSPLNGVVESIHVRPNQFVSQGDLLLSLDSTTLFDQRDIALQSLAVAETELITATQIQFNNIEHQQNIAHFRSRVKARHAELDEILHQLQRTEIFANQDGIALFGDPQDWLGQPVMTGQAIMLLTTPETPALRMYLPVSKNLPLENGASVKFFLSGDPLQTFQANLTETGYKATLGPDGQAAYQLLAEFEEPVTLDQTRIGLRGVARIQGERMFLGTYLLRQPWRLLQAWFGL